MTATMTQEQIATMPFLEFDKLDIFQLFDDEDLALAVLIARKRRRMQIRAGEMVEPSATIDEVNDVTTEYETKFASRMPTESRPPTNEPKHILDWRTMPDGNSKRHAYYASREWALLKARVRERSGGTCEICNLRRANQVHHQTYERLYAELLTDLLDVCEPCHQHLSGK